MTPRGSAPWAGLRFIGLGISSLGITGFGVIGFWTAGISLGAMAVFPAMADDAVRSRLSAGVRVTVRGVVDGDTVMISPAPDGAPEVRLVGIQAPKLALGRTGFKAWPLADRAKVHLERMVLGKTVTLYFGGTRRDRHNRHLAHLFRDDGTWVQGHMLAGGMARVYSFPDNRAVVPDMLARETAARRARRGIWRHPFYAVRPVAAAPLMRQLGTFQLIQGRITGAARVKSRVYLNFGDDWRTDFTITVGGKARRVFEKTGIDLLHLKHRIVRVRGWLRKRNGPMIEASHPGQIEIIHE